MRLLIRKEKSFRSSFSLGLKWGPGLTGEGQEWRKTGKIKRTGKGWGKKNKESKISCADHDWGRGDAGGLAVMDVKVGYSSPPAQTLTASHCHILTVSWCFNLNGFHSCQLSVIHQKIKQQSFKGAPALEKAG